MSDADDVKRAQKEGEAERRERRKKVEREVKEAPTEPEPDRDVE